MNPIYGGISKFLKKFGSPFKNRVPLNLFADDQIVLDAFRSDSKIKSEKDDSGSKARF